MANLFRRSIASHAWSFSALRIKGTEIRRLMEMMAIVLGIAGALSAATYHVDWDKGDDGNDGSQARPWKTPWIASGKDKLRPGDTVVVHAKRDGSAYANGDKALVIRMGTARVTWKAAEGETVKLAAGSGWGDTASPPGSKVTVGLGSDDCVLDGFHIWGCVYLHGDIALDIHPKATEVWRVKLPASVATSRGR